MKTLFRILFSDYTTFFRALVILVTLLICVYMTSVNIKQDVVSALRSEKSTLTFTQVTEIAVKMKGKSIKTISIPDPSVVKVFIFKDAYSKSNVHIMNLDVLTRKQ